MTKTISQALQGHLAMLTFSALAAGAFSLGALVANDIAPLALTALRFSLGTLLVAVVLTATGRAHQMRLVAPWRFLLLGSIFSTYFVLMFVALKTGGPVSLAAIFTLTPIMAAGFALPILRQGTTAWVMGALLVGAVGALWVIFDADFNALRAFDLGWSEAIFFIGCLMHALYVPLLRRLNRGEGTLVTTFGVLCGGAIFLLVISFQEMLATDWGALPARVWLVLLYLMVFATATTFSLVSFASMRLPSSKVLAYTYLIPSWVILWELVLGHAAPPLLVLGGVGLTLVALVMLLRGDA